MINPDLSITTNPLNPTYGTIPPPRGRADRTAGALGIAPSQVTGSNLYMGLYALDTFDVTDRLSLTAGARLTSPGSRPGPDRLLARCHRHALLQPHQPGRRPDLPVLRLAEPLRRLFESNRAPDAARARLRQPEPPCLLPNSLVADPPLRQVEARTYEVGFRGAVPNFYEGGLLNYKLGAFRTDLTNDILQGRGAGQRGARLLRSTCRRPGARASRSRPSTSPSA